MPKKDFSQIAFEVVHCATGAAPKPAPPPKKKAAPSVNKAEAKKSNKKTPS